MPLTDTEIIRALDGGIWTATRDGQPVSAADLTINPNSVNVSLGAQILNIQRFIGRNGIDLHDPESFHAQPIQAPFWLQPGNLYLASTREAFHCSTPLWIPTRMRYVDPERRSAVFDIEQETYFFPEVDGRSTCGRIGLCIHQTAGKGDYGFDRPFTLELTVTHPTLVREGDEIGQIYFEALQGQVSASYSGGYSNQKGPTPARLGAHRFQPRRFPFPQGRE